MTRTERQQLAIEKWKASKCVASWVFPTGFGKTRTAIMAIQRVIIKNPTITTVVVVPTKILKDQWEQQLKSCNLNNVNVLVLNTAAKKNFIADFLIIDEVHRSAAEQMSKVFMNCNPGFILGLTATYERLDGREKIILDKYCPVCDEITISECVENGWISNYVDYKVVIEVDLKEYLEANQTFMSSFAFFDFKWDVAMGCVQDVHYRQKFAKATGHSLKDVTAKCFSWNHAMQFRKKFIANHPKKIEIAKKILAARSNTKAITFNSSIQQCEQYGFGYVIHSKKSKKDNEKILKEFSESGPGVVLHNSKMAKEGYDCPGVSLVVITGFNSDKISHVQIAGRAIRFEKGKTAEIFTIVIKGAQDEKWYQKSMEGLPYIELNEQELDKVLQGQKLNKSVKIQEKFNGFRL